jgi:hypothetical protein
LTLSQKVQQLILQQLAEGKQYRDISKNLGVSIGSIANIKKQGQKSVRNPLVATKPAQVVYDDNQLQLSQNSAMQVVNTEADYSTESVINIPDDQEIDFDNMPYHPALDGESGERLLGCTIEPEQVDSQVGRVDILGARYNSHEKITQIQEIPEDKNQSKLRTTAAENQTRSEVEEDTSIDLDIGLDWDAESNHQARLVKWVMSQKKIQQNERRRLWVHWKNLERQKKLLEREKLNFSEAEDDLARRIYQVRDLLPIADEMKRLGLDFTIANAFLICVKGIAERRGLSEKQAVWKLADDLKNFEFLGGFETSIKNAKHQLELLEYAIEEKKAAISALIDLKKKGIYEREIIQVMETIKPKNNGHGRRFEFDSETDMFQSQNNNPFGDN